MDAFSAFMMGELNRHKELMVFNWELAARIIVLRNPEVVSAGLRDDWGYTGGEIYRNGKPVPQEDTYTYLISTWAVPEIDVDGEVMECYLMQSETPGWDSSTYWPPEALRILEGLGKVVEGEVIEVVETKLPTEGDKE